MRYERSRGEILRRQQSISQSQRIRERLVDEQGTLFGHGRRALALVYPSPYAVGMASLGYQTVYRQLNELEDTVAERAFLPDDDVSSGPLLTYESQRPAGDFPVVAFSVAYELELTGLFACLSQMGLSPVRAERTERDPFVLAGGPLTFSNPVPLAPFVDAVVMGEAEDLLAPIVDILFGPGTKAARLRALAELDGVFVPALQGETLPPMAQCDNQHLPATSAIVTPHSALSNMFLLEPERGCSRGCTFCVMRRTTNGGMRLVSPERVLASVPNAAPRVGLVGAAVTDHPRIVDIVGALVERGHGVGISSLRADRLTPEFVKLLQQGGYRTLTIASDGASERLRRQMEKKIRAKHLLRATELARDAGMPHVKVYMMLGVPGESQADLDELVQFSLEQQALAGPRTQVSLGVSPFVAKRNTPLDGEGFAGIRQVENTIKYVRRHLKGRVELRPTSARWAWVEYELAQGGAVAGLAAYHAWRAGGRFSDWKAAFAHIASEQTAYRNQRAKRSQSAATSPRRSSLALVSPPHRKTA